ncbi:MAG: VWA domain-containing protein [Candidatus Doudnabacteria bacterium]|nr:VWA domain-containing protein [Candidatus Doudnabacteria bacterium]
MSERSFESGFRGEEYKKKAFGLARWVVLGASLLIPGCSDFKSGLVGEKAETKKTQALENFDFANSFPVDAAELNGRAEVEIRTKIEKFLEEYNNKEKFTKLNSSRISIEVSSDERPTKKWEKGNEGLSTERLKALDGLLRNIIETYKFSSQIDPTALRQFRRKTYTKRIAAGSWGVGFLPITQLINPATKERYKPEEIKKLSGEQLSGLYDQARYARVAFELPGDNEVEVQYAKLVEIMASYDKITILADRSESMSDDYGRLGKKFGEAFKQMPSDFSSDTNHVVTFERGADLDSYKKVPSEKLEETLSNLRLSGGNEQLFNSLDQVLEKKLLPENAGSQRAVIVLTDEGIQDFSWSKLVKFNEVGSKEHIDIYFALVNGNDLITFVDRQGLAYEFEQLIKRLSDDAYFPAGTSLESKHEWFEKNTRQVQLGSQGSLFFRFGGGDLSFNLRNNRNEAFWAIRQEYIKESQKAKDDQIKARDNITDVYRSGKVGWEEVKEKRKLVEEKYYETSTFIRNKHDDQVSELEKKFDELRIRLEAEQNKN